ncbi:hypothetical protein [Dactylosporangium sp. CA-139066]|uniref:hypothetical protein n=1 Tax=Dactylosporangium sp. CA-139066 TaxID=3239930 RepID=UPI003D9179A9
MALELRRIDERWILDHAQRLWDWLDDELENRKVAAEREKRAEERHKELLAAINTSTGTIVKTLDSGFRLLADALRR